MSQHRSKTREIDAAFALLSNATRRAALRYLSDVEGATARELARHLTSGTRDADGLDSIAESRQAVVTALVHKHLPRLAEHDIVAYDGPPDEVTLGSNFDAIEPFVDHLERSDDESADRES
ncbi:hypothetical protein [Natrinema versiforme]|uniref:DUF7344 domain-containing protein n=1 Tax=Natrinema versiforme TaxID=88724 RepID=A0A4P8WG57_9EURY|nr:hypothetical protein [Natrinema versiforme]QCS42250.1 hypothetical protein FEJ81_07720 [Natrinema versiforme]